MNSASMPPINRWALVILALLAALAFLIAAQGCSACRALFTPTEFAKEKVEQALAAARAYAPPATGLPAPPTAILSQEGIHPTPKAGESELEALQRQQREILGRIAQYQQAMADLKATNKNLGAQMSAIRLQQAQAALYWTAVAAGIGFLASVILWFAIGKTDTIRRFFFWSGSVSLTLGVLVLTAAWLLPYLMWIVVGSLTILVGGIVWYWRKDHGSLTRVVQAFETVKPSVPNYKSVFKNVLTKADDANIDGIRAKLRG